MSVMKKLSSSRSKAQVKKTLPIGEAVSNCDIADSAKVQLLLASADAIVVAGAPKTIAETLFNKPDVGSITLPSQYILDLQVSGELSDSEVVELLVSYFTQDNEETNIENFVASMMVDDEVEEEEAEKEEAEEEGEPEEAEEEVVDVSEVEVGDLVDYRPKSSKPPIRCKVLALDDDGLAILQNILKPKEKFLDVPGSHYVLVRDAEVEEVEETKETKAKSSKAESKTKEKAAKDSGGKFATQEVVIELDEHDATTFDKLMAKSKLVANKPNAILHSVAKDLGGNRRLYALVENNTEAGRPTFDIYVQDMRKDTPEDDKVLGGLDAPVVKTWNQEYTFDVPSMKKTLVVSFN